MAWINPDIQFEMVEDANGYRVSSSADNNQHMYIKFKKNTYTNNNNGLLKIHIYDTKGTFDGVRAWNIENRYGNIPSAFLHQPCVTAWGESIIDTSNMILRFSDINWISTYNEDETDATGRLWTYGDLHVRDNNIELYVPTFPENIATDNSIIIEIDADFPIFMYFESHSGGASNYTWNAGTPADDYAGEINRYGNLEHIGLAENYISGSDTIDRFNTYYVTNVVYKNGVVVKNTNYQIQAPNNAKLHILVHEPHDNNGFVSNAEFNTNKFPLKLQTGNDPTYHDYQTIPNDLKKLFSNTDWTDYDNGDLYVSHLYTNVKILYNLKDVDDYERGLIPEDETPAHPSNIGTSISSNAVNTTTCNWIGQTVWSMNYADILEIFEEVIYTPDSTLIDEIKSGLWLWNSDPIKCISSLYYVPFNVNSFYDVETGEFKLGSYKPTWGTGTKTPYYRTFLKPDGHLKTITLFDTIFTPIYNDFRDYDGHVVYDLFLPFMGFVNLDVNKYLNKKVKCEMLFDASTHSVRYYLYVNGCITDRFDCSVGVEMPLTSDAKTEKLSGVLGSGQKVLQSGTMNVMAQTPTEKTSSFLSMISSGLDFVRAGNSKPSVETTGSFSSALNTYDVRYAYLRITESTTIKPDNLHKIYNYASYFIGKLSNLSGYCQIDDIRITSTATDNEINEIKNLMKKGVIF